MILRTCLRPQSWTYLCSLNPYGAARPTAYSSAVLKRLDLQAIDRKWQRRWKDATASNTEQPKQNAKTYILPMFPYPSGTLHMGHLRVYTIADVLARFKRMQGYDVLYPIGWDAFGLPAENAAIERGVDPAEWTRQNIAKMKEQLETMNGGFDWSREFMTCDPSFYKHTQHIFLLLHEQGLAYQAESIVNYDPIDKTVLANEQVDANGCSWRSGAKVERKKLKQWFLRISKFKEALLGGLDYLGEDDRWPARVLSMQRNWLGCSEGATVKFRVKGEALEGDHVHPIQVFTTRPDTLFGVQYLALSVSHPLVSNLVERYTALKAFVDEAPSLPADSKVGFQIPGLYATNPLSNLQGMPSHVTEPLPVFVAPYVLSDYGEGAVMGVPGHDVRDNEFWRCNQGNKRIRFVVSPSDYPDTNQISASINKIDNQIFTANGILTSLCGPFSGLSSEEGSRRIVSELASTGDHAMHTQTWKLRDWLISRQRYWGTPIPMIHCHECGTVPVPLKDLPVKLPKVDGAWFKSKTGNPLESAEDWVSTQCPTCGSSASRDTDTMDTFVDSSWYFMRFVDPHNDLQPFSPEKADSRLPVDIYIGGIEHAILHLLYARFISKFLATTPLWPSGGGPENRGEPFRSLITQGMVHGKTYSDPDTGRFLRPEEVDLSDAEAPKIKATGETPTITWEKMSKSKYNGVEPTQFIQKYGADVTRAHILFQAPVSEILLWEESRIVGIQRWFSRLWRLVESAPPLAHITISLPKLASLSSSEVHLYSTLQKTIASVTTSFSTSFTLNTTVSDLMSLTNTLAATSPVSDELYHRTLSSLLRLLAPIAPAFAEECWECLHTGQNLSATSILTQPWPVVEKDAEVKERYQSCAVMENGKLRFVVEIRAPSEELADEKLREWVLDEVKGTEMGRRWLEDRKKKQWKRVVIVKGGRVVNFVG